MKKIKNKRFKIASFILAFLIGCTSTLIVSDNKIPINDRTVNGYIKSYENSYVVYFYDEDGNIDYTEEYDSAKEYNEENTIIMNSYTTYTMGDIEEMTYSLMNFVDLDSEESIGENFDSIGILLNAYSSSYIETIVYELSYDAFLYINELTIKLIAYDMLYEDAMIYALSLYTEDELNYFVNAVKEETFTTKELEEFLIDRVEYKDEGLIYIEEYDIYI